MLSTKSTQRNPTHAAEPAFSFEAEIPNEVGYEDDVDFIGKNYTYIKKIQEVLKKKYQLKEYTSISKKRRRVERSKKVGSLIHADKDAERRKQLATVPLYNLKRIIN